jgi:hypothetical protein
MITREKEREKDRERLDNGYKLVSTQEEEVKVLIVW